MFSIRKNAFAPVVCVFVCGVCVCAGGGGRFVAWQGTQGLWQGTHQEGGGVLCGGVGVGLGWDGVRWGSSSTSTSTSSSGSSSSSSSSSSGWCLKATLHGAKSTIR